MERRYFQTKSFGSRVYMERVVTGVLKVVIFHVEKYNGQEHIVPTPKIDKSHVDVT